MTGLRQLRAAVLAVLLPGAAAAAPARAPAVPRPPALAPPQAVSILTPDSVTIAGQWFAGSHGASTVVIPPRWRGDDPAMREVAVEFQRRGFSALTFTLRDAARPRESDSLRYAVMTTHWVDDMVGALRAAAARGDSTTHLYAWGQGLGGALALSAAARQRGNCDAVAAEDIFPTTDYVMRQRGTAVIPDAVASQLKLLNGADEPFSAISRLRLPVYAILVGAGAGGAEDPIYRAFRRNRGRTEAWARPHVASPAPPPGSAQVDTLGAWFKRWDTFPRTRD